MRNRLAILIALMIGLNSALAACGDSASDNAVDSANDTDGNTAQTSASDDGSLDNLPELDFEGEVINVLYRDDVVNSFYVGESTGDIVDDAVYAANRAVEERINVDFNLITQAGTADADRTTYISAITNSVMAGDNAYDLTAILTYNIPTLIQSGVLLNLLDVQYLDFDQPWWVGDLTEMATINGKLYFASGDVSLELTQKIFCMLFNKDLAETLNSGDIYQLVLDGKWTLDNMKTLATAAYADLNGNTAVDPEDRYGLVVNDLNSLCGFIASFGMEITTPDDNGVQHINFATERTVDAIQALTDLLNDNDGIFYQNKSDALPETVAANHDVYRAMFKNDNLLFITTEFNQIATIFRDMQSEYGVIPYPKFDESQTTYNTVARNTYSSFAIPKTCTKTDAVGAAIEALASENYRTTSHVYFETALKVKYSRDDVTSQMYDIIKEGMKFNFGYTFNGIINNVINLYCNVVAGDQVWTTEYAAQESAIETSLAKFYEDVGEIE